jgi:hypothetical protein
VRCLDEGLQAMTTLARVFAEGRNYSTMTLLHRPSPRDDNRSFRTTENDRAMDALPRK